MKSTRKIYLIVTTILVVILAAFVLHVTQRSDNTTIKIGVAIPLTGTQAHVGGGLRNAIRLAQSQVKDTKYSYEVVFEDTQFDQKTAATVAQKLISVDKVDVILDAYAPIGNVISPIAEENKVVHIGIAFDPKVAVGEYNFIMFTKPDTAVRTFLQEMRKKGLHTISVFWVNNQGIISVNESLKKLSPEYGISILSNEGFQPGERDFRQIVAKSIPYKADIYVLLSLSPELELLAKQLNNQGVHNQTTIMYFELSQDKALFNGLWSVGYSEVSSRLEAEYKAAYNTELTFAVPNMYDAFNTVVRAAESYKGSGKPSKEYIANYIQNSPDIEGATGLLHVDKSGIIDAPPSVKIMREGKLEIEK